MKQLESLQAFVAERSPGGLCIAFSGGVDSAVLLKVACMAGGKVHPLTMYTPFHSPLEPEHAAKQAREYGAEHHILTMEEMDPEVMGNPKNRCYLCKHRIFTDILEYAKQNGLATVMDGTNADDLGEYRPGLQALRELGVVSPLAQLGQTKEEVRAMARELGLEVAAKPSAPCLATRFPYGTPITTEALRRIDGLESYIKELGPLVVRARAHGNILRIEVPSEAFPLLCEHREDLAARGKEAGFDYVTLDLEGFRSGSMDLDRE